MNLSGVLTLKGKVFALNGRFLLSDGSPVSGQIHLEPEGGNEPVVFKYEIQPQTSGYALKATLQRTNGYAELEAHSTARHKFDWDLYLQVSEQPRPDQHSRYLFSQESERTDFLF